MERLTPPPKLIQVISATSWGFDRMENFKKSAHFSFEVEPVVLSVFCYVGKEKWLTTVPHTVEVSAWKLRRSPVDDL